ncbi:MAG: hypothetical protein ACR2FN_08585 [Chitinophagaceae bacterium]
MEICFKKIREKEHVISCKRKDGSDTWMKTDEFFVMHDLMHYAVETTLHYKTAFYGMLAQGVSITDFELPKNERTFSLTKEAGFAENIVNVLFIELRQQKFPDFNSTITEIYRMNNYSEEPPLLTEIQLQNIRAKFHELCAKWNSLKTNETLQLMFDE